MNGRGARVRLGPVLLAMGAIAACKGKDNLKPAEAAAVTAKDQYAIDSARMELDRATAAAPSELAGSYWQLVQLRAPKDSVIKPEKAAVYTVEFGKEGQVLVAGGCNRGGGTYTVTPPKGLRFGPLATTRAMCPPQSISARFLGDFSRMTSYQLVAGHLYISLADDRGVYEFAPEVDVVPEQAAGEPVPFACRDSTGAQSRILAAFTGSGQAGRVTLTRRGKRVVIPQVPSGSGAKYEGSGVMFWNKGRDAMVTWQGTNLNCAMTKE